MKTVVLDVRSPDEYRQGHIPGSKNIPLEQLDKVTLVVKNKDIQLFVYCYSGARSRQAVSLLQNMGYTNVTNMEALARYKGRLER